MTEPPGGGRGTTRMPAPLADLVAFVNTHDVEAAQDELRDPEQAQRWFVQHGLPDGGTDEADWLEALAVREGLRAAAAMNNGAPADARALAALRFAVQRLGFGLTVADGARVAVAATTRGGEPLAPLMSALLAAQADGTWARVKACGRDRCRWVFYDSTRNRSRTWCTGNGCGGKERRASRGAGPAD